MSDRELRVAPGSLLAAWPDLRDPNFMHSVILMCEHTEQGAYGLVVNRATEFTTEILFSDQEGLEGLSRIAFPVHLGGPVDPSTVQFVHRTPDRIRGGVPLPGGLVVGGELEDLAKLLAEDGLEAGSVLRMFVGYSGWSPGQLEVELASGSWIPAPPDAGAVLAGVGEPVWRRVVRSVGETGRGLEDLPPDVTWN